MSDAANPTPETPAAPGPEAAPAQPAPAETPPAETPSEPRTRDDYFARAMAALGAAEGEGEAGGEETPAEPAEATPAPEQPEQPAETPAESETPAEQPVTSEHFAALQRQQAELQRQAQQFQQERQQFEAERQSAARELEGLRLIREGKHLEGLERMGMTYQQLTAEMLGRAKQPKPGEEQEDTVNREVLAKIEALEQKLSGYQEAEQLARAEANVRSVVGQTTEEAQDRWELLRAQPGYERQVIEFMNGHWERSGARRDAAGNPVGVLTFEDAADKLEAYLFNEAVRRTESSKVRKHLGLSQPSDGAPAPQPSEAPAQPATQSGTNPSTTVSTEPRTLTPAHAANVARDSDTADPEACRRRAMARLEQLNND